MESWTKPGWPLHRSARRLGRRAFSPASRPFAARAYRSRCGAAALCCDVAPPRGQRHSPLWCRPDGGRRRRARRRWAAAQNCCARSARGPDSRAAGKLGGPDGTPTGVSSATRTAQITAKPRLLQAPAEWPRSENRRPVLASSQPFSGVPLVLLRTILPSVLFGFLLINILASTL